MALAEQLDGLASQARAKDPLVVGAERGIPGIDVSHWQREISWPDVVDSGVHFVYIKASDGLNDEDPRFRESQDS